jgi:hypothetical protein
MSDPKSCCCSTRKGLPCPIDADREREGAWYCHIHDPQGTFRQQHPKRKPRKYRGSANIAGIQVFWASTVAN